MNETETERLRSVSISLSRAAWDEVTQALAAQGLSLLPSLIRSQLLTSDHAERTQLQEVAAERWDAWDRIERDPSLGE